MATNNALKKYLGRSIIENANDKVSDGIIRQGKSLPCKVKSVSGSIVTVTFLVSPGVWTLPDITIPVYGSEYVRLPLQIGDTGVTIAADTLLGGVSGLGSANPTVNTANGNLSTLFFIPLGSKNFQAVDGNSLVMYGPEGVTLQNKAGDCKFVLTSSGIVITVGGNTITMNASGITLPNGDVIATNVSLVNHLTSEVQSGTGVSGKPVPS